MKEKIALNNETLFTEGLWDHLRMSLLCEKFQWCWKARWYGWLCWYPILHP